MRNAPWSPARRALLARACKLTALGAVIAAAGRSPPSTAKAAKSEFMYQDHRHDGKSCGQCRFFSPEAPDADAGTCSIVEGVVSRDGWCAAFVPKILA